MADAFHLKFLLATLAGWVNRHQAMVIDNLVEENRVLKERLDNNPIHPRPSDPPTEGEIVVDERLGGLLRSYCRAA